MDEVKELEQKDKEFIFSIYAIDFAVNPKWEYRSNKQLRRDYQNGELHEWDKLNEVVVYNSRKDSHLSKDDLIKRENIRRDEFMSSRRKNFSEDFEAKIKSQKDGGWDIDVKGDDVEETKEFFRTVFGDKSADTFGAGDIDDEVEEVDDEAEEVDDEETELGEDWSTLWENVECDGLEGKSKKKEPVNVNKDKAIAKAKKNAKDSAKAKLAEAIKKSKKRAKAKSMKESWEDNGYTQHVWINIRPGQDTRALINILGEPNGQSDDVLDYYFDSYKEATDFTDLIPSSYTWDAEELDYNKSLSECGSNRRLKEEDDSQKDSQEACSTHDILNAPDKFMDKPLKKDLSTLDILNAIDKFVDKPLKKDISRSSCLKEEDDSLTDSDKDRIWKYVRAKEANPKGVNYKDFTENYKLEEAFKSFVNKKYKK